MKVELLKSFKALLFVPFFILMVFTSCQNEETDITDPTTEETFDSSSVVAQSILRTATYDGSYDNILDSANCFSVNLPVTIQVNGITLTIESVEDFGELEDILEALDTDDDDIEFNYPITITLSNYQQITINNDDELDTFINECFGENEYDDDVECIDFQYPISISIFNSNFDVIDTVEINDDEELYDFIEDLEGGVLASINYPVTMVLADGSTIQVNNNQELETAIDEAEDACDEDDDYDYNDDDCTEENIEMALKECFWEITHFNGDDIFNDYELNFKNNDSLQVFLPNNSIIEANWTTFESEDGIVIALSELDDLENDLGGEWTIDNCDDDHEFDLVNGDVTMQIEQECNYYNGPNCTEAEVDAFLGSCAWNVVNYNGSNDLIIFNFGFNNDGTLSITGDGQTINANWSTSQSNNGGVEIEFTNINAGNIQAVSGNWLVVDCQEERLEMQNGNSDVMVMERDCSNNVDTVENVQNYIVEGNWVVASYIDSETDETANYSNYTLDFATDGTVVATDGGSNVFNGTWSAYMDTSNNDPKFLMDFGTSVPFDEFNDDWDIDSILENRLELSDVSGGDGTTDTLVFEKL